MPAGECQGPAGAEGFLGSGGGPPRQQGRAWQPILSHPSQEQGSWMALGQPQPQALGITLGMG